MLVEQKLNNGKSFWCQISDNADDTHDVFIADERGTPEVPGMKFHVTKAYLLEIYAALNEYLKTGVEIAHGNAAKLIKTLNDVQLGEVVRVGDIGELTRREARLFIHTLQKKFGLT